MTENKRFLIDDAGELIDLKDIEFIDYASEQRQKNICNPFIAKSYEIICCDVRELAKEIGVDLE